MAVREGIAGPVGNIILHVCPAPWVAIFGKRCALFRRYRLTYRMRCFAGRVFGLSGDAPDARPIPAGDKK